MKKKRIIKKKTQQSQKQSITINFPKKTSRAKSQPNNPFPIVMNAPSFPQQQPIPQAQMFQPRIPEAGLYNPMVNPMYRPFSTYDEAIPQAQAYRLPPELEPIPLVPVYVERNSGSYIPYKPEIFPSSFAFQGEAYKEPIRDFEQTQSRNDLLAKDRDIYNTNLARQQSIIDNFNLMRNTGPNEDDIPASDDQNILESPIEREYKKPGRIAKEITQEERTMLERYLRIKSIPARQRSPSQQLEYQRGYDFAQSRKRNPYVINALKEIQTELFNEGKPDRTIKDYFQKP